MCIQIIEQDIDIFNAPRDAVLIFVNRSQRPSNEEVEVISGASHDFVFLPLYTEHTFSIFAAQKLVNTITRGLNDIVSSSKTCDRKLWLSTNAFAKYNVSWDTIKKSIESMNSTNKTVKIINVVRD